MPSIDEAYYTQQTPLNADLKAGIESISYHQTVTFTRYIRLILPMDGFAFWVKADLLSPSAIVGSMIPGAAVPNAQQTVAVPASTIVARGSLHFSSSRVQDETEVYGINRVIFTSEDPVHQDFSTVGNGNIYIAKFSNPQNPIQTIIFAFSNRQNFYQQAGIWHYEGEAVYPFMESQIIDSIDGLDTRVVVSNSLPLWLRLNNYTPSFPAYGFGNSIPLYPSHLVTANIRPPYAAVHVYNTDAIASVPFIGKLSSHYQLMKDRVKITFYGVNNATVMTFIDCVMQYILDYDYMGLMNSPAVKDEKLPQTELSMIAMKKSIEFEVSYYQQSVRDIARQIICQAIPSFIPGGGPWGSEPKKVFGPYGPPPNARSIAAAMLATGNI